ncbi:MAG: TatD family hydrolase [Oscillospiraceae bacterium]|nr:TatD family hydrolase [Oscillospiraceae bacterium]
MNRYFGIIDTHAHYDDEVFQDRLSEVLAAQKEHGIVGIIENSSDIPSSERSVKLAQEFDFMWAAVGVHPQEAERLPEGWLDRVAELAKSPKVVAIGEIGLDYYYPEPQKESEIPVFEAQLALARDMGLPIQVHDRDAHGDVLELLKKYRPSGTVHRFSGSPEMAREVVRIGMVLGIGGALTYKNARKERAVVEAVSLENIILETDCPYLAPQQYRGKVSTSDMLPPVVDLIAELKGETPENVIRITSENARRVFGLD